MRLRHLLLSVLLLLPGCELHDWWYYREFREVNARLRAIPNVEVLHSWGNEDVTFEDIGAELNIRGKGRLKLYQLTAGAFTGNERFFVAGVGNLEPRSTSYGFEGVVESATGKPMKSVGYGGTIAIGGDDPSGCCVRLHTVKDVIENYDALSNELSSWRRCPEFTERVLQNGNIYRFCAGQIGIDARPPEKSEWVWWR